MLMQPFSRGVGLEAGALAAPSNGNSDPILFFCDVDMKFNADFLYRCRVNAVSGKRVYFPIVFSLYRNKVSAHRHFLLLLLITHLRLNSISGQHCGGVQRSMA